jgi:orotate phosphoribosyltransferase
MSTSKTRTPKQSPEEILKSVDAWLTGHFLLTSGLHGSEYIQCQRVLQYPRFGLMLAETIAQQLIDANLIPDTVIGPALGAIHWEVMVAVALDRLLMGKAPIRALFAERVADNAGDPNSFAIRRGLGIAKGEKVLVVEDVTTTGGSAKKVVELIKSLGGTPIAVAAIVDRSGSKIEFGIPFHKLVTLNLASFAPGECPMCKEGSKPVKPGSSKQ